MLRSLVYELLPAERFLNAEKPSWVANQRLVERIADEAPAEVQDAMEYLGRDATTDEKLVSYGFSFGRATKASCRRNESAACIIWPGTK